jgi:hypothetical protein
MNWQSHAYSNQSLATPKFGFHPLQLRAMKNAPYPHHQMAYKQALYPHLQQFFSTK